MLTEEQRSMAPRRETAHRMARQPVEPIQGLDALADAILVLRTRDEVRRFLRDLCTFPELEALTHRWQTALLLEQGMPYVEIAERVPTSTATVTRVAQWLRHGAGGYRIALDRLKAKARR
jgi:TrpR-related protein YerC/YecD